MLKNLAGQPKSYVSRYAEFWGKINWHLPDAVLATIWNTDRGNLRARRVRLRKQPPRWRVRDHEHHPVYKAAIQLEKLKARKFTGAKPANISLTKEHNMKIATEISLEIIKRDDDGRAMLDLHIKLLGVDGSHISADIDADEDLSHPRIIASSDTLGLPAEDRQALAVAAYTHMLRYFGDGPTGGTIKWARWVEVDLTPWIRQFLYQPTASRVIRTLSSASGSSHAGVGKAFTESLEV